MRKIFLLILLLNTLPAFAFLDSLRGYSIFYFGQSKWEIENILKGKKLTYDTVRNKNELKPFYEQNFLRYNDKAVFDRDTLVLNVKMNFDSLNKYKFYSSEVKFEYKKFNIDFAFKKEEYLINLFKEKYGFYFCAIDNMDMKDDNFLIGKECSDSTSILHFAKTKEYIWRFENGEINAEFDYRDFYYIDENRVFSKDTYWNRFCRVTIKYTDLIIENEFFKNRQSLLKEEKRKEEEQLKDKF